MRGKQVRVLPWKRALVSVFLQISLTLWPGWWSVVTTMQWERYWLLTWVNSAGKRRKKTNIIQRTVPSTINHNPLATAKWRIDDTDAKLTWDMQTHGAWCMRWKVGEREKKNAIRHVVLQASCFLKIWQMENLVSDRLVVRCDGHYTWMRIIRNRLPGVKSILLSR